MDARVDEYWKRLAGWRETAMQLAMETGSPPLRLHRERAVDAVAKDTESLIERVSTAGDPFVRVAAVLVGES